MSLIASVLKLDRAAVKALRITDPYSLHRVVYGLYPDVRDAGGKAGHTPSGILHADQGGDFHSRNILLLADRIPFLGKLPGDVRIEGRHGTFHFPVVTCLAISVVLTVVANLVARWFRH